MQKYVSHFPIILKEHFKGRLFGLSPTDEVSGVPADGKWSFNEQQEAAHFKTTSSSSRSVGVEQYLGYATSGDRIDVFTEHCKVSGTDNVMVNVDYSASPDFENVTNIFNYQLPNTNNQFSTFNQSFICTQTGYYRCRISAYSSYTVEFLLRRISVNVHTIAAVKPDMLRFTIRKESSAALNWLQRPEFVQDTPVRWELFNNDDTALLVSFDRPLIGSGLRPLCFVVPDAYWGENLTVKVRNAAADSVRVNFLDLSGRLMKISEVPANYHLGIMITN